MTQMAQIRAGKGYPQMSQMGTDEEEDRVY
jgi:hypothetical protein